MANQQAASEKQKLKAALDELRSSTRDDYKKLAKHFYETRLDGQPPTPKRVRDALRLAAANYRPDYWRRLRNALMYDQVAKGYLDNAAAIAEIANPVTQPKTTADEKAREQVDGMPGKRQQRVKKISDDDLGKLYREVMNRQDIGLGTAIMLAKTTGVRPAEMLDIQCMNNNVIFVPGAKKTTAGDRGLDRYIQLSHQGWLNVRNSLGHLRNIDPGKAGTIRKIQDRLRTATKALWPRRKHLPTLYSFRYAMGSELKASGLSRREIAYIMGHQATASVDKYGDRRSGSGRTPIKAAPDANMSDIRETHTEPFSQSIDYDQGPTLG